MGMEENTKSIVNNAIMAENTLKKLFEDWDGDEKIFRSLIHLRPTTSGVTVVSTVPGFHMRGLNMNKADELEEILTKLKNLLCTNDKRSLLEKLKFDQKESRSKNELEEDVQAFLIRDMIINPSKYHEIQFVASEFDLLEMEPRRKRADVIGYKDSVLYDIELKRERLTEVVTQARKYTDFLSDNIQEYEKRLAAFPYSVIEKVNEVKGIALMPKSTGKIWADKVNGWKEKHIDLWYYEGDNDKGFSIDINPAI